MAVRLDDERPDQVGGGAAGQDQVGVVAKAGVPGDDNGRRSGGNLRGRRPSRAPRKALPRASARRWRATSCRTAFRPHSRRGAMTCVAAKRRRRCQSTGGRWRGPPTGVKAVHMRFDRSQDGRGRDSYHHGNLREALIETALRLIAERGPGRVRLRRAGARRRRQPGRAVPAFSPTATRCSTEMARRGFDRFAADLETAWNGGRPDPVTAIEACGRAYLDFARREPALYAVMFESGVTVDDPELRAASRAGVRRVAPGGGRGLRDDDGRPAAGADGGAAHLVAGARRRLAVRRPRRTGAAQAADVARGSAGGRAADLPAGARARG